LLRDLLLTDERLLHLASHTADEAIVEMADRIPRELLPADAHVGELAIARERELPTHVGGGVGIPHARCPGLAKPLVVFGRSTEGIDFGDQSSELVHLVFLLVTPADQPDTQVHLLSLIAGVAGQADKRRRLLEAESVDQITDILTESEDLTSSAPP
jgi:mannitol/fructose-specific phosphotransferase system IIA component (Ntr-type)